MNEFSIQNNIESRSGTSLTVKRAPQPPSDSFGQVLMNSLNRVNQLKIEADAGIENLARGRQTDIHQTMIADHDRCGEGQCVIRAVDADSQ